MTSNTGGTSATSISSVMPAFSVLVKLRIAR